MTEKLCAVNWNTIIQKHRSVTEPSCIFMENKRKLPTYPLPKKLAQHPAVIKPWIFYREGESVIAHSPNPYVALYYIAAATRKELDAITEEFFSTMEIPDSSGEELLWQNRIPIYLS